MRETLVTGTGQAVFVPGEWRSLASCLGLSPRECGIVRAVFDGHSEMQSFDLTGTNIVTDTFKINYTDPFTGVVTSTVALPYNASSEAVQTALNHVVGPGSSVLVSQITKGGQYMPPIGENYTDRQVAATATFVRNSFGNDFGAVQPADVLAIRRDRHGQALPRISRISRAEDAPLPFRRFNRRVHHVVIGGRDGNSDSAKINGRKSRFQFGPTAPAID